MQNALPSCYFDVGKQIKCWHLIPSEAFHGGQGGEIKEKKVNNQGADLRIHQLHHHSLQLCVGTGKPPVSSRTHSPCVIHSHTTRTITTLPHPSFIRDKAKLLQHTLLLKIPTSLTIFTFQLIFLFLLSIFIVFLVSPRNTIIDYIIYGYIFF